MGSESPQYSKAQILGELAALDPGWILLFHDGLNLASDVRAQHSDAIIIGRLYVDQITPILLDEPEGGGHRLAQMCLSHPANAIVNGWQAINEPDTRDIGTVKRAAALDLVFATDLLAADRWAGIGSLGIGHPVRHPDIRYWIPALRLPNSILFYHAYRHLAQRPEWSEFRYRFWAAELQDADVTLRIALTETGHEPGGWRKLGVTEDNYISGMTRWADEWRADGILGTALFCLRHNDARYPDGNLMWYNFDILGTSIPQRLGDYNRANPWARKIAKYPKEKELMPNAHTIYDKWARLLGGSGYNPNTAIGRASQMGEFGICLGGEENVTVEGQDFVIQPYAMGIAIVRVGAWLDVSFCLTEHEIDWYINKYVHPQ